MGSSTSAHENEEHCVSDNMNMLIQQPVVTKEFDDNDTSSCGHMQGWRPTMEDYNTIAMSLDGNEGWDYYAVFDGHIDDQVAKTLAQRLHIVVADKIRSLTSFNSCLWA